MFKKFNKTQIKIFIGVTILVLALIFTTVFIIGKSNKKETKDAGIKMAEKTTEYENNSSFEDNETEDKSEETTEYENNSSFEDNETEDKSEETTLERQTKAQWGIPTETSTENITSNETKPVETEYYPSEEPHYYYVPIEDKFPQYVCGRWEGKIKNLAGKDVICLYLKEVEDDWELDYYSDTYMMKFNDEMYWDSGVDDYLNCWCNRDEEFEGTILDDNTSLSIPQVYDIQKGTNRHTINGKELDYVIGYIKPYFYDENTHTITKNSNKFVSKELYLKYLKNYIWNAYYTSISEEDRNTMIEEAGILYDAYMFWYNNCRGTEFECFLESYNSDYRGEEIYYIRCRNYGDGYNMYLDEINRINSLK